MVPIKPGCIPCKTHAGGTPVAPQVYVNVGGWRTPEVQRSKNRASRCGFFTPVRQSLWFRVYPRRHADRKANCTPEIFGPKCMECTLAIKSLYSVSRSKLLEPGEKYRGLYGTFSAFKLSYFSPF